MSWTKGTTPCVMRGGLISVRECLIYKDALCIYRISPKVGWAIGHRELGLRVSCGGRVIVSEEVAMRIVERIYPLLQDWRAFFSDAWKPNERWLVAFTSAWQMEEPYGFLPGIKVNVDMGGKKN